MPEVVEYDYLHKRELRRYHIPDAPEADEVSESDAPTETTPEADGGEGQHTQEA